MNAHDHYLAAEHMLALADKYLAETGPSEGTSALIASAQAHALLAKVDAENGYSAYIRSRPR